MIDAALTFAVMNGLFGKTRAFDDRDCRLWFLRRCGMLLRLPRII